MHTGYEETSQSKILKCQICVPTTWGMYHTVQRTAEIAVQMHQIKDYQLVLVTFNMANVRWSTFLSTIRMVIVLVVNV